MKEKIEQILMSLVADEVYGPGIYAIYIHELADEILKLTQPTEKPPRLSEGGNSDDYTQGYRDGWRDCCKDVKEFG